MSEQQWSYVLYKDSGNVSKFSVFVVEAGTSKQAVKQASQHADIRNTELDTDGPKDVQSSYKGWQVGAVQKLDRVRLSQGLPVQVFEMTDRGGQR